MRTSTSPAFGGVTSTSVISSGLPASHATAARDLIIRATPVRGERNPSTVSVRAGNGKEAQVFQRVAGWRRAQTTKRYCAAFLISFLPSTSRRGIGRGEKKSPRASRDPL